VHSAPAQSVSSFLGRASSSDSDVNFCVILRKLSYLFSIYNVNSNPHTRDLEILNTQNLFSVRWTCQGMTCPKRYFRENIPSVCRSQWPRGLRHELSSSAQTLGSWVRIALEARMSMCFYSAFVLSCVQVSALRRAHPPFKESYRQRKRSRN
jgi:hypothetical protein